jgi:hypothetical protein
MPCTYNNKTTLVWFLREKKHTSDGLWPRNPPQVRHDIAMTLRRRHVDLFNNKHDVIEIP